MTGAGQILGASTLHCSGLAVRRGGRVLLSGFDLKAGPGDAIRLTGPNGIGKSSLIRVLAGLLRPFAGDLAVEGRAALADEGLALERDRPLRKALQFWADLDGSSDLDGAMQAMGLSPLAAIPARLLSTGQRKRAALARVIASGAPIWLLDEPGNGLDDDGVKRLEAAIEAHRAVGGIILYASHFPLTLAEVRDIDLTSHMPVEGAA